MARNIALDLNELTNAIAASAPKKQGAAWNPKTIAKNIVAAAEADAALSKAQEEEFQAIMAGMSFNFTPSAARNGDAAAILRYQAEKAMEHRGHVEATLKRNRAVVQGLMASAVTIGGLAIGGAPTTVLVPQVMTLAVQIANALNGE